MRSCRKRPVNAEFEKWRADTLSELNACRAFWTTHEVFWEENRANAVGIERNLEEAARLISGIPFRCDERADGYRRALDAELSRIGRNRGYAEGWKIMQDAAQKIVCIAREWISL